MPKYEVNLTFSLATTIEPEVTFDRQPPGDAVLDFSDDSSYYGDSVSIGGGDVRITVEAEDEDAAGEIARSAFENAYGTITDDNGLDWEVEDLEVYGVEALDEPMTADRAFEIVEAWLASGPACPTPEQVGAIVFLLALIKTKLVEQV